MPSLEPEHLEDADVIAKAATISEYHGVESQLVSRGSRHASPDAHLDH